MEIFAEPASEQPDHSWATKPATFANVCQQLIAGSIVFSVGFTVRRPIRDRCGFVEPTGLSGLQQYVGFSDDYQRPRLLIIHSKIQARGNDRILLPSGNRIRMPSGSFFVDAEIFDELMIEQSLRLRQPLPETQLSRS